VRAPAAPLICIAVAAAAAPSGALAMKPDFTAVRSREAAEALVAKGELVRILAFPAEFGGEDRPENRLYVTPAAATARAALVGSITRMIRDGSLDQLKVEPEYRGDSFVPASIRMKAWHSKKPGSFEPVVEVW
jgi:hypothetical protein